MIVTIKKLSSNDSHRARELLNLWSTDSDHTHDSWILSRLDDDHFHIFVAFNENEVIGGLTAYTLPMFTRPISELFIYEVEVSTDHRRTGAGTKLMKAAVDYCQSVGIKTIFLCTDLDNAPAQKLYENIKGTSKMVRLFEFNT